MNRNDQHTKYSWEQTEALKLLFFPAENKLSQVLKPFNYAQFIELRFILTALRTNFCSHIRTIYDDGKQKEWGLMICRLSITVPGYDIITFINTGTLFFFTYYYEQRPAENGSPPQSALFCLTHPLLE